MKKNNQLLLTLGIHSIVAIALVLTPFTLANAATGIATGTISQVIGIAGGGITPGASPGQKASFAAMNFFCTGNGNLDNANSLGCDLTRTPNNFLQMQQLSSQSALQTETISITSPYQFIRNVNQHAQRLRDCQPSERRKDNIKKRRSECNSNGNAGGGSSSDAYGFIEPFGVSFSGGGGFGDRDSANGQTGFNIDARQANLTIDYTFNQQLIGGFAFNYTGTDRTLDLASGTLNSDSYRFAPFLSYTPTPNSYVTLMGGYARVDFDSVRKISSFKGISGTTHKLSDATASYGANEYFASLGVGYTYRMDAWSLRSYGRGDYNHLNIGGFQENGGQDIDGISYANTVNGQSIISATSTLGAELSYAFSTSTLAAVIIPRLYAEWVHEFKNSSRQMQTTLRATGMNKEGKTFNVPAPISLISVAGPERNWANVGAGVQMLFPHAIVGYLNYDTLFIENASNQTVSGGIRMNF
jgi:uncharacterized protein with beta-barrel porin domain